jgi:hypothetical protein
MYCLHGGYGVGFVPLPDLGIPEEFAYQIIRVSFNPALLCVKVRPVRLNLWFEISDLVYLIRNI